MIFPFLLGIFLYRLDISAFYPPVPPGVKICFTGFADDCHYRGDIYRGPGPTEHILNDPAFDCGVDESEDFGRRTAMLFVKLSGGRCVLILSPKASHLPHRVMRLSSWTTFAFNNHTGTVHMVAWTYIVHPVIHLYQAKLNNVQHFTLLTDCFEQNAADSRVHADDDRSDEQAEYEIAEIVRKFRACLRYGNFSKNARQTIENARLAYRQLWVVFIVYASWCILAAAR